MAAKTLSTAKDAARTISAIRTKAGLTAINAKRVRAWVRENIAAYDDDGYTAHLYDARTLATIVKGMTASGKAPRSTAATRGRSGKATAPKATPRKATPKARAMGTGPVARNTTPQVTAEGQVQS